MARKIQVPFFAVFVVIVIIVSLYMRHRVLQIVSTNDVDAFFEIQTARKMKIDFIPETCKSGYLSDQASSQRDHFKGVEFTQKEKPDTRVRIYMDDIKGNTVTIYTKENPVGRSYNKSGCSKFDMELQVSGSNIKGAYGINGQYLIDCPGVKGKGNFVKCY